MTRSASHDEANYSPGVITDSMIYRERKSPDVYRLADFLAGRFGCTHIIDLGCGSGRLLAELQSKYQVIGIDNTERIELCRAYYDSGTWIEHDFNRLDPLPLDPDIIRQSVIVCSDTIHRLGEPANLLRQIHDLMEYAPVALLSTPEREAVYRSPHNGPARDPLYLHEWNRAEFNDLLKRARLNIEFIGLTDNGLTEFGKDELLAVISNNHTPKIERAPDDFRVASVIHAYNDADILFSLLEHLVDHGIEFYVIDNWSTDNTPEIVQQFKGNGLIGFERFPEDGPPRYFELGEILVRIEEVIQSLDADWIIHEDCDEFFEPPWQGMRLKDAIYRVEKQGFTCIDHTLIDFQPTDNLFSSGHDAKRHFRYWEPGNKPAHYKLFRSWKNQDQAVGLAESGGHEVNFPARRVYPYKFLIRHYRIRSQEHGERKVFHDRFERFNPEERAKGWHIQYDHIQPGYDFLRDPLDLYPFNDAFFSNFLVERISGIGWSVESERLEAKHRYLRARYKRLANRYARLRIRQAQTRKERDLLDAGFSRDPAAETRIDQIKADYRKLMDQYARLHARHLKTRAERNTLRYIGKSEEFERVCRERDALQQQAGAAQRQVHTLHSQYVQLRSEHDRLQAQYSYLVSLYEKTLTQTDIEKLLAGITPAEK